MTEQLEVLALAGAVYLLVMLYLTGEARRAGEQADALGDVVAWMKCQERIERIRDRQIEILTKALTRSENPDISKQEGK